MRAGPGRTAAWWWSPASRAWTRRATSPRSGRGGSDTSAVALAAALKADECQIYTDVDGVYTTDPRIVPEARRLHTITFEEMLEMASLGSKVLQIRSVEFAGKYKVPTARALQPYRPEDAGERRRSRHADHFRGRPAHGDGKSSHLRRRRSAATRPRSPCTACPTGRASPTRSSARSPTPTSTST